MALSINTVKEIVFSLAQKQGHATISPQEFIRYANMANMDEYSFYTEGIKSLYKLGKGMPTISPNMNKMVSLELQPFLVTAYAMTLTGNVYSIPTNAEFIDTVSIGDYDAKWIPYNMVNKYLKSTIDLPTSEFPVYTDVQGGLRVYPSSAGAKLTYLRKPTDVNWAYTIVGGRTPTYTSVGTVDFEWGESHKLSIVTKILGYIGISIRDIELKQLATAEEQKSN